MNAKIYDKSYFNFLTEASVEMELFKKEFPKMDYPNFNDLVEGLLEKLNIEIGSYEKGLKEEELEELKEFPEYMLLLVKKKYCLDRKREYEDRVNEQKENLNQPYRNIIFAKTPAGNPCLMQDLKDIDLESYPKFLEALMRLRNNDQNFNSEKQKPMSGNNNSCNGLYEIKSFQFRLIYIIINKETVMPILAEDKIKDTSSIKKIRQPAQRKELVINQVKKYQEALKDENLKQQIIAENDAIYDELVEKLGRGRNIR